MIILGDVNGDGRITIEDVIITQAQILGISTLTEEQKKAADVNEDGKITSLDLRIMQKHLLGLDLINKIIP